MDNLTNENREVLLSVVDLKKYYPVHTAMMDKTIDRMKHIKAADANIKAVDGVNLHIYQGETLGLVGESGCGKSTIGRQIVGLENPTDGQIYYRGQMISSHNEIHIREYRTKIQMVFQDHLSSLNPRKRVRDILYAPLDVHRIVPKDQIDQQIVHLLDLVGISSKAVHRYPHEFSGGQRQRIGIARALATRPELIICDEPVSALDVSVQAQILNLLKGLQEELHVSYLFIGHGLGAVKYISHRIAVMYLGKIVEIATAQELFHNPRHPYTKAMVDATPIENPRWRDQDRIILSGDVPSAINPPKGCNFHTRCPFARDNCKVQVPDLVGVDHRVACIRADEIAFEREARG